MLGCRLGLLNPSGSRPEPYATLILGGVAAHVALRFRRLAAAQTRERRQARLRDRRIASPGRSSHECLSRGQP